MVFISIFIDAPESEEVPIAKFDADTLKKMVDYCDMVGYKNEINYPPRIKEEDKFEDIVKDDKEREFITKLSDKELQNLVECAHFLDIKRLFELCCIRIAYFFRAKENNIEKIFGVQVGQNKNIELAMKDQYSWAFEIDADRKAKLEAEDKLGKDAPAPAAH